MPTYEYVCKDCGERLEAVQSFSDEPLTDCPHCNGDLRKIFGNVGIVFRGSGFYKTDSRSTSSVGSSNGAAASDSGRSDSATSPESSGSSTPSTNASVPTATAAAS